MDIVGPLEKSSSGFRYSTTSVPCGAGQSVATRRDVAQGRATQHEHAALFLNAQERELIFGCPHAFLGNKQVQPRYEPSSYKKSKNLPPLSCCERDNGMTSP
ncbi:hypothetical protein AOLI_G00010360 [Acnodon oligacanthus]